jgi:hypothetical protein
MTAKTTEPTGYSESGRRQRAEALDAFVKETLTRRHAEQAAKIARLRALRLGRSAES